MSSSKAFMYELETRLKELKTEKHEMFMKLKKVLTEDETRRRQQLMKDAQQTQHGPPPAMQPVMLQPPISQHGSGRLTLNKHPAHHPSLLQMGMKRPRSPTPPRLTSKQQAYRHEYLYKGQPLPSMSYGPLSAGHPHVSVASVAREESHHPVYMAPSRGYGMASHSVMDAPPREKGDYYGASHRQPSHMGIRSTPILPVQQPQSGKSGGITSGYPVRTVGPGAYPPASGSSPAVPTSRQAPPRYY
ncbi:G protein pathway suppressor 2-like [Pollicipes pollicipes]|uniref:G protein pathway suppressor 2-like n=1 Tax=Pollicipes pollicipes TaxID=41117 RepID=UPI0018857CE0|nr:G protein pathway suppressor 2-like [Pollicipes pollicipes]